MTASALALIAMLAAFFMGQKYFVRGIALTGTKGRVVGHGFLPVPRRIGWEIIGNYSAKESS